ncbi:MAG: ParB N-terminal domain-containing protein [Beijerinckiaceae bacterium]|nr:ParB N-terminal domain-containing protein [Beijerinckiaceae bacterium]
MTRAVKVSFERQVIMLALGDILPVRTVSEKIRGTVKYKRIIASVAEVGLIEPLSVCRHRSGGYLLLDGHIRLEALRLSVKDQAPCIVADDDEAFTYNKRVNRLATIQEHYMIVRAMERGVSEQKLARALNLDVKVIRQRRNLLAGISKDVTELLKDKAVGHNAFQKLRKMKPIRQLEVAELMISANNYTDRYVKALLATSKAADLHRPDDLRKATGLTSEQMVRLEREMSSVTENYKEMEASYGDDMLVLVVASGFLERMLTKPEIERFLANRHPEFLKHFRSIVSSASLDQSTTAGV